MLEKHSTVLCLHYDTVAAKTIDEIIYSMAIPGIIFNAGSRNQNARNLLG